MDKKNTILLTVIAVATLLVAVVGATFAYFSITATNSSSSTVITTTTGSIGTVALTSPNTALKINLAASDMAETNSGSSYYSVLSSSSDNYLTEATNALVPVLLATVTDTNASTTYNCTASVKLALAATNPSHLDSLVEGDGEVVFGGALAGTTVKLNAIKTGSVYEKTISNVTMNGLNSGTNNNTNITAYLKINNTSATQDYLQNESITVTITAPTFTCEVVGS